MKRKLHTPEQIVKKLREADARYLGTPYNGTKLSRQPCSVTWYFQKAEFSCLPFYQSWLDTIRSIGICLRGYMMQHGRVNPMPFGEVRRLQRKGEGQDRSNSTEKTDSFGVDLSLLGALVDHRPDKIVS